MQHARVRIGGHTRIAEGPKSTRPSRGSRVDYAQKMQEMQWASPGTASAKAEVALEMLESGESTSQRKAAAAVGVHESTLSLLKRQSAAPYAKFNRSGTRLVELPMGVTYVEELSFGSGGTTRARQKHAVYGTTAPKEQQCRQWPGCGKPRRWPPLAARPRMMRRKMRRKMSGALQASTTARPTHQPHLTPFQSLFLLQLLQE